MKLTTKGRYGLKAMVELALRYDERPVLRSYIAKRQDISSKYLHTLLTKLRKNGLVKSVRGKYGGFILTRPPAEIKISDILVTLEGTLSVFDKDAENEVSASFPRNITDRLWKDIDSAVIDLLDKTTLQDMVEDVQKGLDSSQS